MNKKYSAKNKHTDSVSLLMGDITTDGRNRRRKDADKLAEIRNRQNGDINIDREKQHDIFNIFKAKRNKSNIPFAEYDDFDDDTEVIGLYEDNTEVMDDDTEVMGDDTAAKGFVKRLVLEFNDIGNHFSIELSEGITTIGTSNDCNIVLKSRHVSRFHAKIIKNNIYTYIVDCGSTNGTYINGNDIRIDKEKQYDISAGDIITLADIDFYIREVEY